MHSARLKLAVTGGLLIATVATLGAARTHGDSSTPQSTPQTFTATLAGSHEVPAVNSKGTGMARFVVKNDSTITYVVSLKGMPDVTGAHIHLGAVGASGAPVATLIKGTDLKGKMSGTITPKDLTGTSMSQLIAAMRSGGAYVNVHTKTHPDGEVRGEIEPGASATMSQVTH